MNVPLSVAPIVKYGKEKLNIWAGGVQKIIDAPIQPYFYSNKKQDVPTATITELEAIALSSMQKKRFYKYEFKTRIDLVAARDTIVEGVFEGNILFTIRNRIDNENLYTKFPHSKDVAFLFLDIEQYMKPGALFPDYSDRIISISYCTNDREIRTIYLGPDKTTDAKLLEKFMEEYQRINPDILVVYNKSYDIITLINRCLKNHIDTAKFSKNGEKPNVIGKDEINIEGVVIYDVLKSTQADQSLTGNVANHGLKEVSNWFGFKETATPLTPKEIVELIGTDKLIEYNKDDVRRLLVLFDIYWPNISFNSNDLKIPLDMSIELNTTELGLITIGDEYKKRGIIADGSNHERYAEIFQRKKDKSEPNYQGALVDIYRTGLFKPIYKADFGSMYPSIMSTFNLSPDTTTFIGFEPKAAFSIEETENWFIYRIPDDVLKQTIVLQVLKKEGFMSAIVARYLKERLEFKKLSKQTGEKKYQSMSDNRKLKANGTYGIMGSETHAFGFVPIAMGTTGIGRECIQLLIDVLNELYPKSVIEIDTDGIYFATNNFDKQQIFDLFYKRLKEKFKKDLALSIDIDEYDCGYFYKAKNYVLKRKDKLIYHGAALKARSKDLLSKNLIKDLTEATMDQKSTDDIIRKYLKLEFPLNWFVMNITLGMSMRKYANLNAIAPRMAAEAQSKLGIKPEVGLQYHYIKTSAGYKLYQLSSLEDIDKDYYTEEINRIAEMFKINPVVQKIDKWL